MELVASLPMYILTPNEEAVIGWRGRVAGVWICTPEDGTLHRNTFGSQGVMKARSNGGGKVPLRKVPQSRVGEQNLRRGNAAIWICSENEWRPYDPSRVQANTKVSISDAVRADLDQHRGLWERCTLGKIRVCPQSVGRPLMALHLGPRTDLQLYCKKKHSEMYTECLLSGNIKFTSGVGVIAKLTYLALSAVDK